jgi:hypothetical protein
LTERKEAVENTGEKIFKRNRDVSVPPGGPVVVHQVYIEKIILILSIYGRGAEVRIESGY